MKKYTVLLLSSLVLALFSFSFSSCKDDEPIVKPKLSFAQSTVTVSESSIPIEVEVVLDKPAPEDITITYTLGGSAIDRITGDANNINSDYEITSDYLEVEIKAGETTGIIEITLYSDFAFENTEAINISIEDVDSNEIEITRSDETQIVIQQQDGMIVLLEWPRVGLDSLADMDIVLRVGSTPTTFEDIVNTSADDSFSDAELVFLPKSPNIPFYGLSYVYFEGTYKKLPFTATFIDWINGTAEPEAQRQSFNAFYSKANINRWTSQTINTTLVVQTLGKSSSGFGTPSNIIVPPSGSRIKTIELSDHTVSNFKKTKRTLEEIEYLHSFLKKIR
jgi:hypothetical protein